MRKLEELPVKVLAKRHRDLLEKYNKLASLMKQAPLFQEEAVIRFDDLPKGPLGGKTFEGWSVIKRKDQQGFFFQKTVKGFHVNLHVPVVPETDGGIHVGTARDCISRKLCAIEKRMEKKADERLKQRRARKSGFTLLELMIVLCLMGIIAAIAMPNFMSWKDNYNVKIAAQDIYSAIQKGKIAAVRQNLRITITAIADRLTVSFNNPPALEEIIETVVMPEGVALAHTGADLRFRPNSLPMEITEHNYTLTGRNRTLNVRVSPAGGVSIQ